MYVSIFEGVIFFLLIDSFNVETISGIIWKLILLFSNDSLNVTTIIQTTFRLLYFDVNDEKKTD